jgi:protocatechuate 3,4-dioxygenase, beta subunit
MSLRTPHLSRRSFAAAGLATLGIAITSAARAQKALTAESPMGPFYPILQPADSDADLTLIRGHSARAAGQVIEISGRVFDVKGNLLPGASIELWQANAAGRYAHPADIAKAPLDAHFQGFASLRADPSGGWRIRTIKPAGYDSPIGKRPPHIHFQVSGKTHRHIAQLYFPEDAQANAVDQLYSALGPEAATSLAVRDASDPAKYSWDIVLLG